jgi:Fe-S cluster assembly protein SufB
MSMHSLRLGPKFTASIRQSRPPPRAQAENQDENEQKKERPEKEMPAVEETVEHVKEIDVDKYKYGFETEIETIKAPKGLNADIVRFISDKKGEPIWMLEWRLEAFRRWLTMDQPTWARVRYPKIDFQDLYYYAAPKSTEGPKSLDEVDPELLTTYEKLGIPLKEQEILAGVRKQGEPSTLEDVATNDGGYGKVAIDAVFDSVSVVTTFKEELAKAGVIFCSISEAIREHPDLVKKYLGSVVPTTDNFFATLNSAVFSDGSFVYLPEGVRCPMELSTYFRINEKQTGQFERTLIIADKGSYVSYLEGCTAPMRDENQLHAAVVELVALDDAEIKYSTVQNWYPGDKEGKGGVYNFVTKRGDCRGRNSKISWTQVETGSAITWKYPSCILRGDNSVGEFYSIAISNGFQQVDSGTKMIHLGKNTTSRIISKGIAAGRSENTYRGLVSGHRKATGARNFTACDSLLIGDKCGAHTIPYIEAKNSSATFEHEATTSKISDDQLFYCQARGMNEEEAVALIVNGFVRDVLQKLPMEFMAETQRLIGISLEGSVG